MHFTTLLLTTALALASSATATLEPAISNSKNRCPKISSFKCAPEKVSYKIQAAECSHNTRTHTSQTFALFRQNHAYDDVPGAPYGSCGAYTCAAPVTPRDMKDEEGCWTFFWDDRGKDAGVGTGCIRSPDTGECGCENSTGEFVEGGTDCK